MKRNLIKSITTLLILTSMLIGTYKIASASAFELVYDDGGCDGWYPQIHNGQYLRQKFLVTDFGISGDCLVETVSIWWHGTTIDFTGVIKLRDYDTGELVNAVDLTEIGIISDWIEYEISGLGFVSDQFYVELWQTSPTSTSASIGGDINEPINGMSEASTNNGETWTLFQPPINFMIRVTVIPMIAEGELAYDDGECDLLYPSIHHQQYLRERFLVTDFGISGDCLVETVRVFWFGAWPDFTGEIKLRDYDTGELITAASLGYIPTSFPGQWYDYDVSGSSFVNDHFYVELWQTSPYPTCGLIGADKDPPYYGMSEVSTDYGENWGITHTMNYMIRVIVASPVLATINVDPDMLALVGRRPWINAYVEFPCDYDVANIDISSIELSCDVTGGVKQFEIGVDSAAPVTIGDRDGDSIPDLMIMFDRFALVEYLQENYSDGEGMFYDLPIKVTGMVSGKPFECTDTIRIMN
jgi:hypothetical protein